MNDAHLHLIINHFPIITPILALIVMACGYGFKSPIVVRVAYLLFVLSAIFAYAANATGEGAEEIAEHLAAVDKKLIHAHEEFAETFALLSYVLGAISIVALWANWKKKSYAKYLGIAVILLAFLSLYFAQQTGNSGGEIRHPEISESTQISDHAIEIEGAHPD